jgi:hypothetical protein
VVLGFDEMRRVALEVILKIIVRLLEQLLFLLHFEGRQIFSHVISIHFMELGGFIGNGSLV